MFDITPQRRTTEKQNKKLIGLEVSDEMKGTLPRVPENGHAG